MRRSIQSLVLILCAGPLLALVPAPALAWQTPAPAPGTRVVLLGTGTPNADPDRWGPASAVVVNGQSYIVDCGVGVVRRAAAAARQDSIPALRPRNLRRVFITHLHSDHTLGCPDLLLSPWVLDRDAPLQVWGPEGTARMFHHITEAYREDIAMRIYGLEPRDAVGYRSEVHEIQPGLVYQDENVKVTAFLVHHGTWPNAFGFRFQTADRVIVFSGDTAPTDAVVEACNGCDVLVHEVISAAGLTHRSPAWQAYHHAFHTTTIELADIARRAHPALLLLNHQLFSGVTDAQLVKEITDHYQGRVISGKDLGVY